MPLAIGPRSRQGPPLLDEQTSPDAFAPAGQPPDTQIVQPRPLLIRLQKRGPLLLVKDTSYTRFPTEGNDRFVDTPITHPLPKFRIGRSPVVLHQQQQFQTEAALFVPGLAALTITTSAPAVLTPRVSLPSAGALVVTGATPVVLTPRVVLPSAASLILTAATPAVATPRKALPSAASLVVSGATPAVLTPRAVAPAAASLTVGGATPAVRVGAVAQPSAASLAVTGAVPAVTIASSGVVVALPDYAVLNLRGYAPFVEAVAFVDVAVGGDWPRPREPLMPRPKPVTTAPTGARLVLTTSTPAVVINDDELVLALAA